MQVFRVDDMSCGHCASSITKAVRAVDAAARVDADLGQKLVRIEAPRASTAELADAIAEAGYAAVPVAIPAAPRQSAERRAGCCGCCG